MRYAAAATPRLMWFNFAHLFPYRCFFSGRPRPSR